MMRFGGSARPVAWRALRTLSPLSFTALSGSPTMMKRGSPGTICTWTSTGTASIP